MALTALQVGKRPVETDILPGSRPAAPGSRLRARPSRDRVAGGPGWQSRGKDGVTWRRAEGPHAVVWLAMRSLVLPGLRVVVLGRRSERVGAIGRREGG